MDKPLIRFELELLGGGVEQRYRKLRPDIDAWPWGSLANREIPEEARLDARRRWTSLTFNEYGSAAWMSVMAKAMLETRAPLDLTAYASRFVIDELSHAELGAMMAMELGGATEVLYHPDAFLPSEAADHSGTSALYRAAALVIRIACVDEVLSLSLLRGLCRATVDPLALKVLRMILRDEAEHAAFGSTFLRWAMPRLSAEEIAALGTVLQNEIDRRRNSRREPAATSLQHVANPLWWMDSTEARAQQAATLEARVVAPLRALGLAVV